MTVVPTGNHRINVNFASPELMGAVIPGLDEALFETQRKQGHFKSIADFETRMKLSGDYKNKNAGILSVLSFHFIATGTARWAGSVVNMQVLLQRSGGQTSVVWQKIL